MVKKQKPTYFGQKLEKHIDKLIKKYEKEPKTPQNLKLRIQELQWSFFGGFADCINDLEARLRKIEQKIEKINELLKKK